MVAGVAAGAVVATAAIVTLAVALPDTPQRTPATPAPQSSAAGTPEGRQDEYDSTAAWLRTDSDIPREYRKMIVAAGRHCELPGLSPALIAAMLKAESGFDPNLDDPRNNEYGIARWTPEVLWHWQPGGLQSPKPSPPLSPELSISSMGRFLCTLGPRVSDLPGDPALKLAALYRSGVQVLKRANGIPDKWRPYTTKVARYMRDYQPEPD
ncbi:hypothetical protein GCM10027203_05600 [Nonomuraea fastidiosa]